MKLKRPPMSIKDKMNNAMLTQLEKITDRAGTTLRPHLLLGLEEGMRKLAGKLTNKGKPITVEALTEESLANARFVAAHRKAGITPEDITALAHKVTADINSHTLIEGEPTQ